MDTVKSKKEQYLIKCICCKQLGHLASDCPMDPNIKSKKNVYEEVERIEKRQIKKKLFSDSDTQLNMMQFLAKNRD